MVVVALVTYGGGGGLPVPLVVVGRGCASLPLMVVAAFVLLWWWWLPSRNLILTPEVLSSFVFQPCSSFTQR